MITSGCVFAMDPDDKPISCHELYDRHRFDRLAHNRAAKRFDQNSVANFNESQQQAVNSMYQKRHRTTFNHIQLAVLEEAFRQNSYPCPSYREALAAKTNLDVSRVQVWFQNRRAKHKKQVNQAMRCFASVGHTTTNNTAHATITTPSRTLPATTTDSNQYALDKQHSRRAHLLHQYHIDHATDHSFPQSTLANTNELLGRSVYSSQQHHLLNQVAKSRQQLAEQQGTEYDSIQKAAVAAAAAVVASAASIQHPIDRFNHRSTDCSLTKLGKQHQVHRPDHLFHLCNSNHTIAQLAASSSSCASSLSSPTSSSSITTRLATISDDGGNTTANNDTPSALDATTGNNIVTAAEIANQYYDYYRQSLGTSLRSKINYSHW